MTSPALPEEFEELMELLDHVAPDRRGPIARMLFEKVAECPRCGEPIRRCEKRAVVETNEEPELLHLVCAGREPERELSGEELQEAKDAPVRRWEALRAEAAEQRRRRKS